MSKQILKRDIFFIGLIGVYCLGAIVLAIFYFLSLYDGMRPEEGYSETILFKLILVIGMFASTVRGASDLLFDVKELRIKRTKRQSLSYLIRPIEGAVFAIVVYFIMRAGLLIFEKGWPTINPWGFFAIAGIAGFGAHKVLERFSQRRSQSFFTDTSSLTQLQISHTFEYMVQQIFKSDADEAQKLDAKEKLKLFLEQPLVNILFGGALEDVLYSLSGHTRNEEANSSTFFNHAKKIKAKEVTDKL